MRSSRCAGVSSSLPVARRRRTVAVSVMWAARGIVARKGGLLMTRMSSSSNTVVIRYGTSRSGAGRR